MTKMVSLGTIHALAGHMKPSTVWSKATGKIIPALWPFVHLGADQTTTYFRETFSYTAEKNVDRPS